MQSLKRSFGLFKRKSARKRNVVYTSLFGFSERFSDHKYDDDSVDYVCFTDDATLKSSQWKMVRVANRLMDPHRLAKKFKHLPHRYLGDYGKSLYIDNTIHLKCLPSRLFETYQDTFSLFRHPDRDCVYDEAEAVIAAEYDSRARVVEQMSLYRSLGYPARNGLSSCAFLLRDHHNPHVQQVCAEWHDQVLKYSMRDQLSWNVCAWYRKFPFCTLDKNVNDNEIYTWPVVKGDVRLPRDFDDKTYLSLNPDVRAANENPRHHYLYHGHGEKRRYK